MFDRYTLSHQRGPEEERWTYPSQESILEEGDITEEEQECKTGKHGRWDPPILSSRGGGERVVLEDRESSSSSGEKITPLHTDQREEVAIGLVYVKKRGEEAYIDWATLIASAYASRS
jgi:hypothetical protein